MAASATATATTATAPANAPMVVVIAARVRVVARGRLLLALLLLAVTAALVTELRSAAVAASDEDISTISSAYPSLRSLAIWSEQGGQHVRHPSLHSLLTIAQKCPGLTDLRLNLDRIQTACIPSTADVDRFLPFPSKHPLAGLLTDRSFLTGLDLKTVEGAEPRALELANLISRIFPVHKLGIVRHGYFPEREMLCDPWRDSRVVWCVQSPVDPFWLA